MPGVPPEIADPRTFIDTGNPLLGRVQSRLETGSVQTPAGPLAILTIRTASTTLTVLMTKDDLAIWIGVLQDQHDKLSAAGLITGTPGMIAGNGHLPG